MIYLLNIFYKLINIIFFKKTFKNKWDYSYDDPQNKSINWYPLIDNKIAIDIDKNTIWFRPRTKLKNIWYELTISHLDLNRFAYITFKNGEYGYSQGRLASSGKRRSRIVKNINNKDSFVCISNLSSELQIEDLSLNPIPELYAWLKIKHRLKDFKERFDNNLKNKIVNWKIYNKALSKTASLNKVVTYSNWIEKVENNLINKRAYIKDYSKYFSLKSINKLDFEYKSDWIIPFSDNCLIPYFAYQFFYESISKNKNCLILYSDEDHINKNKKRHNPNFKPSWNRELFLSNPNFGNVWVISSKIWNKALKQAIKVHNTRNFKIVMLICIYLCDTDKNNKKNIYHLPIIGFHKKEEINYNESNYIDNEYKIFLHNFINKKWKKLGKISSVEINSYKTGFKLFWSVPKSSLLSILIPTKDKLNLLEKCINSINNTNSGLNFEIIIIDNNSCEYRTHQYYKKIQNGSLRDVIRIVNYKKSFNFSRINNYFFDLAKGDVLLFLNNDIEFICNNWALTLFSNAIRPQIGCVGCKLIYPNKTIQHAGVVLGISGTAGHIHKYFRKDENGYQNKINLTQEISAVTGACMAIKKSTFKEIGMFDEILFKVNFNDVDLCLKSMQHGFKNLYVPEVLAIHHESATRSTTKGYKSLSNEYEKISLKKKYSKIIKNDPFYSPYLTLVNEDLSLSYRKLKIEAR